MRVSSSTCLRSMSIVVPRPPLPDEVARYSRDAQRKLLVKPGMTGPGAVVRGTGAY